ncbi:hypothetical protein [Glycomyces sp. NPDC047010]|uniref:hypothetical protein n=1 Tax=Glycomyces sp. NPDC047010 TaxID=3155023 RepID=UPI0034118BE4
MKIPEGYRMREFWMRIAYNESLTETTRAFAMREMNRCAYESMTYREAVLMVWAEEREHWTYEDEDPPSLWHVIYHVTNTVVLDYGVLGGYPFEHHGDALSDAYQIVLRHWAERHGWNIHPDFMD